MTFPFSHLDTGGTYPGQSASCDLSVGEATRNDDPRGSGLAGTMEPEALSSTCTMPGEIYCKSFNKTAIIDPDEQNADLKISCAELLF